MSSICYELRIYGDPKGQPRPRAFARKMGNRYVARVYDSDVADEWKKRVLTVCKAAPFPAGKPKEASMYKVRIEFFLKRPKSHYLDESRLTSRAPAAHTQRPDLDNLAKAVLDAVTDSERFWSDDSEVVELVVTKLWTGGRGGCFLQIRPQ